jgi:hypothetical protein
MELAFATVYPGHEVCNTVLVQHGYAMVQPTFVWGNTRHISLPILVGDEITTIGEAHFHRI